MSIVHRRVFYGKVGAAQELAAHMEAGNQLMGKYGGALKTRILTDNMIGRSDRVVVEWKWTAWTNWNRPWPG